MRNLEDVERENELKHARQMLASFGTWANSAATPPTTDEWNVMVRQRDEATAAVARVRELHSSEDKGWGELLCKGCATEVTFTYWPCKTIRALDASP